MLSAAERVVLRIPAEERFLHESEINQTQIKIARDLLARKLLAHAGKEPNGQAVYKITKAGMKLLGEWG